MRRWATWASQTVKFKPIHRKEVIPMNWPCDEARLTKEEIAEIYRNMEARGLTHVFCQECSEEMKPEQARKSSTGLIMCRPCYMCNDTEATQEEIDQATEQEFPGYLASFSQP
jgi:formylmethanofuran dehydrogenase subunit E